jgi:indolepyruvate ferredoxin oxidoreductase, beta subunit
MQSMSMLGMSMLGMNILLAGVGGQGTVLASKLLAQCGMSRGLPAHTAETIGMAQRGGCVVSHVRIGGDMFSPIIPKGQADVIIGFEPAEAVRNLDYLKPDGTVVVAKHAIRPTTDTLSDSSYNGEDMLDYLKTKVRKLVIVDGEKICEVCGSSRALNIALIGAASACGAVGFTQEDMAAAIHTLMAPKYVEANLKALKLGSMI